MRRVVRTSGDVGLMAYTVLSERREGGTTVEMDGDGRGLEMGREDNGVMDE